MGCLGCGEQLPTRPYLCRFGPTREDAGPEEVVHYCAWCAEWARRNENGETWTVRPIEWATVDEALAGLVALAGGSDAHRDRVAAVLQAAGCHGTREDCRDCPVAEWLRRTLPRGDFVMPNVGPALAVVRWFDTQTDEKQASIVPGPVRSFIRAFDARLYPELVTP